MKNHSINSLLSYLHTVRLMDQHAKKMVFKRFESQVVNSFSLTANVAYKKMEQLAGDTLQNFKVDLESDYIDSDTSGNNSENDEISYIAKVRSHLYHHSRQAVSDNSSDDSMDALKDDINTRDLAYKMGPLRVNRSSRLASLSLRFNTNQALIKADVP